jgi:ABC-2 type transport system permease protein
MTVLGAEIKRSVRLTRSYWAEYVSDFVLYALGFLLLIAVFRAAAVEYGPEGTLSSLLGYVTWKICASVLARIALNVSDDARAGTLEQAFITGTPPWFLYLSRSMGITLDYGLRGILLGAILALILGILRPVPMLAVGVFLLSLIGALGVGFALAGLVLVYKQVRGVVNLVWQALVFFTGALAPIYHPVLSIVSKVLPLTWGIDSLRAIFLGNADLASLWQQGLLVGLLINTAVYVTLGVLLFTWGEQRARMLGVLAHY